MSADFTLGAEEEYQLVDRQTGELRSRARDILEIDWSAEIAKEIQATQIEIGTRICGCASDLLGEIRRLRFQAATTAAAFDLAIAVAGVHPFSHWEPHRPMQDARYERLLERFGRVKRNEHVFGMHVHVAVPSGTDRIRLLNALRPLLPHLLALAASSPIFEGEDTRYASYRTILTRRLPNTGIPPRFDSEGEYQRYVRHLLDTAAIEDPWTLYWSLRPHPEYPTLEFRVPDACPNAEDAAAIAALCRALVAAAAEGLLVEPRLPFSASASDSLLRNNEWLAARYGLDARLTEGADGAGDAPVRDSVRRLLDRVGPVAERLGDGEPIGRVALLLQAGSAADRIREVFRSSQDLRALVEWISNESLIGTGLDRRSAQRTPAA